MVSQNNGYDNSGELSALAGIRDELYRNTLQILELIRERIRLAEAIGREKELIGASMRNRERELEVIKSIPGIGDIEKSVLNMIFEFTVLNELSHKPSFDSKDIEREGEGGIVLTGPDSLLAYSLGLIVSFPGFALKDDIGIPENLALGVIQRGGHIISEKPDKKSGSVRIRSRGGLEVAVLENGKLSISQELFTARANNEYLEAV